MKQRVSERGKLIDIRTFHIHIHIWGEKIFSRDLRIMLLSTMLLSIMLLSVMLLSIMLLSIMLLSIMSFLKLVTEKAVFFLLEQMWLHLNLPCENVKYFERKERLVNIRVLSSIANFLNFIATLSRQPVEISQDSEKRNRNKCVLQNVPVHKALLRIRYQFDAHWWQLNETQHGT